MKNTISIEMLIEKLKEAMENDYSSEQRIYAPLHIRPDDLPPNPGPFPKPLPNKRIIIIDI